MFQKTTMAAAIAISTSLLLVACGGSNGDNNGAVVGSGTTTGALLTGASAPTPAAPIDAMQLQAAGATGACGVSVSHIDYTTKGAAGESTTASAAVMVPTGTDASCTGKRPVVLYAHGTNADQTYNMAAVTNPAGGNPAVAEATLVAAQFAANGYVVIAPNYAGYDTSTLSYHPYVNYKQQSQEMIDALKAGRTALPTVAATIADSGKLFVTGYSEGGYVAMAALKAMDAANIPVTAGAPMSGPYSLGAYGDAIFSGNTPLGATLFAPLLTTGYQKAYKNIYTAPSNAYMSPFADKVESILADPVFSASLINPSNLPGLFQSVPDPTGATTDQFDPVTLNATTPSNVTKSKFSFGFSPTNYMISTNYRVDYLKDAAAHPDGAVPTLTASPLPTTTATNTLRKAFALNDLRGYIPSMPVLMCGGNQDPTVFFSVNTQLMAGIMGNVAAAGAPVAFAMLDIDATDPATSTTPAGSPSAVGFSASPALGANVTAAMSNVSSQLQAAFGAKLTATGTAAGNYFSTHLPAAVSAGAAAAGQAAAQAEIDKGNPAGAAAAGQAAGIAYVTAAATAYGKQVAASQYHGGLVPPYCTAAAQQFFKQYL